MKSPRLKCDQAISVLRFLPRLRSQYLLQVRAIMIRLLTLWILILVWSPLLGQWQIENSSFSVTFLRVLLQFPCLKYLVGLYQSEQMMKPHQDKVLLPIHLTSRFLSPCKGGSSLCLEKNY